MFPQANRNIFGIPYPGPLYIVNDDIWLARTGTTSRSMRKVSSLSGWLKSMTRHVPSNGILANVPNNVSWIDELRLCLCSLIPFLRFLSSGDEKVMKCDPKLEEAVSNIAKKAALLQGRLGYSSGPSIPLDQVQNIFGVPCVVNSTQVIPLEPAGIPVYSATNSISVRFQHCIRKARPLNSVITNVQRAITKGPNQESTANEVQKEVAALMQEVDCLIARLDPVNLGRFKIIYYDRYHQVHYGRGHFVLVRGPVVGRKANQRSPVYVGLPISGKNRGEWLLRRPRACNQPEQLWTDDGVPVSDGMCMGNVGQYVRLFSPSFTDAEAVVQWLDAGVILATGVSLFHREQRKLKLKDIQQRQVSSERRQAINELWKSIHSHNGLHGNGTMLHRGRHLGRSL